VLAVVVVVALGGVSGRAQGTDAVEAQIARLAAGAEGTVGVTAVHLESGRRLSINGGERFPMASVYKFPIGLQILRRVERGELKLDTLVTLTERDYRPAASPLAAFAKGAPMSVTVGRLLELMLVDSDNSASDVMLRLAGGGQAVTARLRELGIRDVEVSRPEVQLMADFAGLRTLPSETEWTVARLESLMDAVPDAEREAARVRYEADPRDTATPDAMAELLARTQRGEALSAEYTALMLRMMTNASTGAACIKGKLPAGTPVAHKTGLIGRSRNDVGIVTLPDGTHVALAIFVKG